MRFFLTELAILFFNGATDAGNKTCAALRRALGSEIALHWIGFVATLRSADIID